MVRRSSLYRRPSISTPSAHSASPGDTSNNSLRHVGEGALDDSDSSGSGKGDGKEADSSSDEDTSLRPLISPALNPTRITPAHPSPLSRVAGQQHWTGDEDNGDKDDGDDDDDDDDEASPSPGSTDTESGGSSSPRRRPNSGPSSRRNSNRMKNRSRSSTVASLAAPSCPRPLVKQGSCSSIRTVTVGEVSFREHDSTRSLKRDNSFRDGFSEGLNESVLGTSHRRHQSQALSEFVLDPGEVNPHENGTSAESRCRQTDRGEEIVRTEETYFREKGWDALRETVEHFANEVRSFTTPENLANHSDRAIYKCVRCFLL